MQKSSYRKHAYVQQSNSNRDTQDIENMVQLQRRQVGNENCLGKSQVDKSQYPRMDLCAVAAIHV
jgi:hypothetical protein